MKLFLAATLLSTLLPVLGLDADGWSKQSIYQIMTDRFSLTESSETYSCAPEEYCGGTWQGIINNLDYIQGMGFTAIWISPITAQVEGNSIDG